MEALAPQDVSPTESHTLEQQTKEVVKTPADFSTKLHPEEEENKEAKTIVDTTEPLSKEQKRKEENEAPADASTSHSVELDSKSKAAETSNELQAPKRKTRKVLKPRLKIAKKSPASNSLNKKKAKVTVAELEGEEEIQRKRVLLINNGNSSKDEDTMEALSMEQENEEVTKSPADVSTEPHSMELENKNKVAETSNELPVQHKNEEEIQAAPDVSSDKLQAPTKRTVKVLKARSKIAKKSPAIASSMKKIVEATIPKGEGEKATKEKDVLSVKNGNSSKKDSLKQSTSADKMQRNADDFRTEEKDNRNLKGKNSCSHVENNAKQPAADHSEEKRAAVLGKSKRKWKEEVKQKFNNSLNNLKDNEKPDDLEKKPRKEKKEKLGGLIFMCNSRTKPDCFKYGVMGIPLNKKDLVLGVRPGLKLFLYDYDRKLMYGIYEATSPGGMSLEPGAFDGAFPVQVRFKVHLDCCPLPESIFKKGMEENFTTKHKFKTELSTKQVSRLAALFRPTELHPKELPAYSPRLTKSRTRDSHVRARESRHLSRGETLARDPYADHQSRRLLVLAHERARPVVNRELVPRSRTESREMYLTEQEYRAFGLRGKSKNSDLPRHISPTLRSYQEDREREHLRRLPEEMHREAAPAPREYAFGRSYIRDKEYRTYSPHRRQEVHYQVPPSRAGTSAAAAFDSYREDPYDAYRHDAASVGPYAHRSRRENIPSGSFSVGSRRESLLSEKDRLRRREVHRDKSHPKPRYIDDLMGQDRAHHYRINENNAASLPVSSRYYFAGPRI